MHHINFRSGCADLLSTDDSSLLTDSYTSVKWSSLHSQFMTAPDNGDKPNGLMEVIVNTVQVSGGTEAGNDVVLPP